jgi:GNAT superfamily N-acetyltransferase
MAGDASGARRRAGAYALRPGTPDDAAALAETVDAGFASYRAFAPPEYRPPPAGDEAARLRQHLADPATWCLVAEAPGGELAGHVAMFPAHASPHGVAEPGLGHLYQLFLRPDHWGTGLAARLLGAAVAEARARGFSRLRLLTPEGQARARRFYEREGWTLHGEPFENEQLRLALVEYRIGTGGP